MASYTDFLKKHVLQPADTLPAVGLAYHIADIMLPELQAVAGEKRLPERVILAMLDPFIDTMKTGEQAMLHRLRCVRASTPCVAHARYSQSAAKNHA